MAMNAGQGGHPKTDGKYVNGRCGRVAPGIGEEMTQGTILRVFVASFLDERSNPLQGFEKCERFRETELQTGCRISCRHPEDTPEWCAGPICVRVEKFNQECRGLI